ncbi:hypothetical protein, partial [Rubrivivax gelatinosus]|uniref:hypothetical protein n=1 Tax=Rubrivivax gelatinosus TaxID=28068 RepID=UPI001A9182DB
MNLSHIPATREHPFRFLMNTESGKVTKANRAGIVNTAMPTRPPCRHDEQDASIVVHTAPATRSLQQHPLPRPAAGHPGSAGDASIRCRPVLGHRLRVQALGVRIDAVPAGTRHLLARFSHHSGGRAAGEPAPPMPFWLHTVTALFRHREDLLGQGCMGHSIGLT